MFNIRFLDNLLFLLFILSQSQTIPYLISIINHSNACEERKDGIVGFPHLSDDKAQIDSTI